jgi:ubiquitin-protein ligase E3 C
MLMFESNVTSFATEVDIDRLSELILATVPGESKTSKSEIAILWLLAHFIALQKAKKQHSLHSLRLKALYLLLTLSSNEIRTAFAPSDMRSSSETQEIEDLSSQGLPPYVSRELSSLVDKGEISGLLAKFTS